MRYPMLIEVLGQYRLELSAMQLIHNGGWVAFAAVRLLAPESQAQPDLFSYRRVVDEEVFESKAAAIAGARSAAMSLLRSSIQER